MTIEKLIEIARTWELEGRMRQAVLLWEIIEDAKRGSPWLELMNGEGLA